MCTTFQEKKRQKYLEFFDAILAKKIPAKKRDFWIQERFAFIFLQLSEKNCTNSKKFRIATEVKKDEERQGDNFVP